MTRRGRSVRRARPGGPLLRRATVVRGVRARCARGQSTVEVVGLLPLLLAAGLAVFSLLNAGRAEEVAGNAAEAGAVALLQGREPRAAARAALAGWPERRAAIRIAGPEGDRAGHAGRAVRRAPAGERDRGRGVAVMSVLLERAASAFGPPAVALDPPRFAPRALVLGRPDDAVPVAAALAGGLREQHRAAGALLAVWPSPAPPRAALGTPAASRLTARLQARGLDAVARGRLAWLALGPDDLDLAARAVAGLDAPAVIAVIGPRTTATDDLLADQDLIVLVVAADADPGLEALALAGLQHRAAPVVVHRPLDAPGARPAAMAGWGRLRVEVPGR